MSDGLIAPANAPTGQQTPVGVQPGVSGIIPARVVLVFGPAGQVSGIFVYAPGTTPGAGNPPVVSVTESSTDPYGNAVQKDIEVAGSNGGYINVNSSGGIGGNTAILFHPGGTTHVSENPQVYGASNNGGLANEFEFLNLVSGAAGLDDTQLQLLSERADASVSGVFNFLIGGTLLSQLFKTVWNIGVPISATLGTASNKTTITTDTWHAMSLLANWSTLAGQPIPSYKFSAVDNNMYLVGAAQFNANIANTALATALSAGPPSYRPLTQVYIGGAPGSAGLQVSSNGGLVAAVDAGQATVFCNFNGHVPLDL